MVVSGSFKLEYLYLNYHIIRFLCKMKCICFKGIIRLILITQFPIYFNKLASNRNHSTWKIPEVTSCNLQKWNNKLGAEGCWGHHKGWPCPLLRKGEAQLLPFFFFFVYDKRRNNGKLFGAGPGKKYQTSVEGQVWRWNGLKCRAQRENWEGREKSLLDSAGWEVFLAAAYLLWRNIWIHHEFFFPSENILYII